MMTSVTFAIAYGLSLAGCWRCGRRLVGAEPLWTIIAALDYLVRLAPDWFAVAYSDTVIHAYLVHRH